MTKPLILVTNDDGVYSNGLKAAAEAMFSLGEVLIVAPKTQQTGMGRSFPRSKSQGTIEIIQRMLNGGAASYYAVNGSPAQAVAHGVLELASRLPTLCISGINNGENLGATSLISGTIGAALEATSYGIPALAVSLGPEDPGFFEKPYREEDWFVSIKLLRHFATIVLHNGLPSRVDLLNINIPSSATPQTPIQVTRQSRQNQYVCIANGPRDLSKPFRLPVKEQINFSTLEPDSDIYAFCVNRSISVTPMAGNLTVYEENGKPMNLMIKSKWPVE